MTDGIKIQSGPFIIRQGEPYDRVTGTLHLGWIRSVTSRTADGGEWIAVDIETDIGPARLILGNERNPVSEEAAKGVVEALEALVSERARRCEDLRLEAAE